MDTNKRQFALIAQMVVWVTKATLNIDVVPNTNKGNAGKPILMN